MCLGASVAMAQTQAPSGGVRGPAPLWTAPAGALAVEANPAAISFLDGGRVRFVHVRDFDSNRALPGNGNALYAASSLPFGLGLGLSIEQVDGFGGAASFGRFSLAASFSPDPRMSMGFALRYLGGGPLGGVTGVDFAVATRPSRFLAVSLVARDIFGPLGLVTASRFGDTIPATFQLAGAIHPLGNDRMQMEVGIARDTDDTWALRGAVQAGIPRVGRITATVEADNVFARRSRRDVRMIGGFELDWGHSTVGVGGTLGVQPQQGAGYVTAEFGTRPARGLPEGGYVANIEIPSGGARGIARLMIQLDRALHDPDLRGVILRPRARLGSAYAQELRLMILALREAGKPVLCHLESASGSEWYACSAATRCVVEPAGNVRLMGPNLTVLSLGGLLDHAGVRADFVRIGEYKSAPEQLMRRSMSGPAREAREAFIHTLFTRMRADLQRDHEMSAAEIEAWIDEGPYVAEEAHERGLVADLVGEDTLREYASEVFPGRAGRRIRSGLRRHRRELLGIPERVAVIVVDGSIVDGENVDVPIVDIHQSGAETIVAALDAAARDSSIRAVVLRVDSPGGSAMASEQIWRAVRRVRARKPVIASMGALAASGGYYIASAADAIWADPATLTGSIGIYYGKVDVERLADRIGVNAEFIGRGRHAGADSMWRPFTDEERARLEEMIRRMYQMFIRRVAEGRGMEEEAVEAVAQGRIWAGDTAVQNGLVDRLGGLASALADARRRANVSVDAPITIAPRRPEALLDYVTGGASGSARARVLPAGTDAADLALGSTAGATPVPVLDYLLMLSRTPEGTMMAHSEIQAP